MVRSFFFPCSECSEVIPLRGCLLLSPDPLNPFYRLKVRIQLNVRTWKSIGDKQPGDLRPGQNNSKVAGGSRKLNFHRRDLWWVAKRTYKFLASTSKLPCKKCNFHIMKLVILLMMLY